MKPAMEWQKSDTCDEKKAVISWMFTPATAELLFAYIKYIYVFTLVVLCGTRVPESIGFKKLPSTSKKKIDNQKREVNKVFNVP